MNRETAQLILRAMFTAWKLHEASWDDRGSEYKRTEKECYLEAANGDAKWARLLELFSHWSNDIQDVAAHFGIAFDEDGNVSDNVSPAPSENHWWHEHAWQAPFAKEKVS